MKPIKEFYKAWPCPQGWQFEPCFLAECPRPCSWGAWGAWGACTEHCGPALRRRSRQVETPAAWEGVACREQDSREVALCQNHPCLETAISDSFSQAEKLLTLGADLLLEIVEAGTVQAMRNKKLPATPSIMWPRNLQIRLVEDRFKKG